MTTNKPNSENVTSINDDLRSENLIDDFNSTIVTSTDANERIIEEAGILMRTRFTKFLIEHFKIKQKDIPCISKHDGVYSFYDVDGALNELWKKFQEHDFSKCDSYEESLTAFWVGLGIGENRDLYNVIKSYGS